MRHIVTLAAGVAFAFGVVLGGHQHQPVTLSAGQVVNALQALREHRVGDRGEDDADQAGALAAQLAA